MKKTMMLLLCASTLWACHNAESKKVEAVKPAETMQNHEESILALNNGARWNGDESTNKNVKDLLAIINRYAENKSINNYPEVANELQNGLDKMIKECRMQGVDHDALHLWLEPLLKKVDI